MNNKKTVLITLVSTVSCVLIYGSFLTTNSIRNSVRNNLISEYADQEHLIAIQLAQVLELEISQREAELRLAARIPEIVSGDAEACNSKLKELYADPGNKFGNYGRVDANGVFKCSINEKIIGMKAESLGAYIPEIFNDPEHKTVMSRATKPAGANSYLIAIHVPVWDKQGNFTGTLGGAIYLNDLQEKYLKGVQIMNGGSIAVYDDDGTVLNHYRPELIGTNFTKPDFQKLVANTTTTTDKALQDIRNGVSGSRTYTFDNEEVIASYEPIHIFPGRNWRIVVNLPTSTADKNIIKMGADKALSGLPIAFLAIILSLYAVFLWLIKKKIH